MKNISLIIMSVIFLSIVLFGCQQSSEVGNNNENMSKQDEETENVSTIEGYILEVGENTILVARNITSEKYEEIKDKANLELGNEGISLISVRYDDISSLKAGNKVEIWIKGGIQESYPAQADAKKIEVID